MLLGERITPLVSSGLRKTNGEALATATGGWFTSSTASVTAATAESICPSLTLKVKLSGPK